MLVCVGRISYSVSRDMKKPAIPSAPQWTNYTIKLPPEIVRFLKSKAKQEDRTMQATAVRILREAAAK